MEPLLDPNLPIIDPHMHLWDIPTGPNALQEAQTFLLPDAADVIAKSGHCITHTVYVEAHSMHRANGPSELRSLGETEFANGMAAMAASGRYGGCLIADRIVANVDLCLGDALEGVLEMHHMRVGERLRGVRMNTAFRSAGLFGSPSEPLAEMRIASPQFVSGARLLARLGLSLDVWCIHTQLDQVINLARLVPDLTIILNHVGTPDLRHAGQQQEQEILADWRQDLKVLGGQANVFVKLSGFGMDVSAPLSASDGSSSSEELAKAWEERFEIALGAFGTNKSMFASNYPAERSAGSYRAIWNAFKRLAAPLSQTEKDQLFRNNAAKVYHIALY